ncbi:MAG: hypothetical protein LAP38_10030 [Acidobacteriia bacterium]|nr:hypothetical protein [Terriglobia bacterium]
MANTIVATNSETKRQQVWPIPAFIMVIVQVANAALVFGLLQMLSWEQCAMVVFSGVALSGGIVFTIATMQRLGKEG